MSLATFFSSVTVLVFVMDPFGNLPIVAAIMDNVPPTKRRRVLLREMLVSLAILVAFFFLGSTLLEHLGIDPSTLDIAGGVILLFISIHLIFPTPNHSLYCSNDDSEPFIVPIAIPLIAGPSAMTIVMLMATRAANTSEMLCSLGVVVTAWAILATVLMACGFFQRILRPKGLRACERLMGMLLILVAIQSILNGLRAYIETL